MELPKDLNIPLPKLVSTGKIIVDKFTNNSVLDLFGGSGSTLIACEQLNRSCYMMELDPKYCSVILERWENLTGKKAEKTSGTS
jgi:site-specific DNA-methyltransferase (adenine-specific)